MVSRMDNLCVPLLQVIRLVHRNGRVPSQNGIEANLLVDLLHSLKVSLGRTLGAKDDVLDAND